MDCSVCTGFSENRKADKEVLKPVKKGAGEAKIFSPVWRPPRIVQKEAKASQAGSVKQAMV